MTDIKERAKEYAKSLCDGEDNFEDSLIYTIHYDEYMEIATEQDSISRAEQQRIDIGRACSNHTIEQLAKCALDSTMSCNQKAMLMKEIIKQAIEK